MGGHGGLNILPQKSWNVYNRDNRLKVERDEAKAAAEAAEAARQAHSEKAAVGLEKMRRRATAHTGEPAAVPQGHINFFAAEERALGNLEHKAEHKAEEARLEARIMPDLQLDRSAREPAPWYTRLHSGHSPAAAAAAAAAPPPANRPVAPLSLVMVGKDGAAATVKREAESSSDGSSDDDARSKKRRRGGPSKKREKKAHKKEKRERSGGDKKRRKHDKQRRGRSPDGSSDDGRRGDAAAAMQRLRQERLERERHERTRERSVVTERGARGNSAPVGDERPQRSAAEEHRVQRAVQDDFMRLTGQVVTLPPRPSKFSGGPPGKGRAPGPPSSTRR